MNKFVLLIISWGLFFAIDMTWIRVIMKTFYEQQMKFLLRDAMLPIHSTAGMFVWLLLIVGLLVFVLPHVATMQEAFLYGAIFGGIVYGVYDLTNFTTLNTWSLSLTFVDWGWGFFVNGCMAAIMYYMDKHL